MKKVETTEAFQSPTTWVLDKWYEKLVLISGLFVAAATAGTQVNSDAGQMIFQMIVSVIIASALYNSGNTNVRGFMQKTAFVISVLWAAMFSLGVIIGVVGFIIAG